VPPTSPFRFLAPAALAAVVVAVLVVGRSGSEDATPSVTQATPAVRTTTARPTRRTATVRPGDSLSAIAARHGLTLDDVLELNPRLATRTLRVGQRVRLRP